MRLVEISRELLFMAWRGAQPKRLGVLALDLLLAREAASRIVEGAARPEGRERAERTLAFVKRLEGQVLRLYATHAVARRRGAALSLGLGRAPSRR